MVDPLYDEYGIPLTQSNVGDRIWDLYHSDPEAFKREVRDYFARGYPGFTVVKASYKQRVIWLRDDGGRVVRG